MPTRQIEQPAAQRAKGRLALAFKRTNAATRIERLLQDGCLKALLPRPQDVNICEAVTLNISGGVAGGDVLATSIDTGAGAQACVAGQAAERIYRTLGPPARITTRITVQAGGTLDYLPQETILFDGFALERSLEIDLHGDAAFLGVESLVFGRLAMGEAVRSGRLRDRIVLRRDGRLLLQDMSRLDGDIARHLGRAAIGSGAVAMAGIIFAGPDATSKLGPLRDVLAGAHAGASAFEGVVFARILAPTSASLRHTVLAALAVLRDDRALPRVWVG